MRRVPALILFAVSPFLARRLVAFVYPRVFPHRMEAALERQRFDGMDNAERELKGVATHP